jgi:hypothetical protein
MNEKVTADTIISFFEEKVRNKEAQFDSSFYLESAMKLTILLGDEIDLLFELKQTVAQKKLLIMQGQEKRNVAAAEIEVESSEEYKNMRKQEAKIDRIEEIVRIAKKMSDVSGGY